MLMSGGSKKKKKKKGNGGAAKRPRPTAVPPAALPSNAKVSSSTSPPPPPPITHPGQPQQEQEPQQPPHKKKKRGRKGEQEAGMGLAAWVILPATECDIIVDRCQKELAPLLGVLPTTAALDDKQEDNNRESKDDMEVVNGVAMERKAKKKKGRRVKPRIKVFSAKDASPDHQYARKRLCIGINEVTRALEKGQLSLLFVCRDVKPPRLVEHLAVLAALRGVPFFVLPKATAALGQALGLQRVAALGIRSKDAAEGIDTEEGFGQVQSRLDSFQAFFLAKRQYVNDPQQAGEEELVA